MLKSLRLFSICCVVCLTAVTVHAQSIRGTEQLKDGPAFEPKSTGGVKSGDGCGSEACCEAHDSPGCDDTSCCDQICEMLPLCCTDSWNELCAAIAIGTCGCGGECGDEECGGFENCTSCPQDCGECPSACPGEGACGEANGTPGCSDEACCESVCSVDPFCCNVTWDGICVNVSSGLLACGGTCGNGTCEDNENCNTCSTDCGECPIGCPGTGSCTEPNDTPGCEDEGCCDTICELDPFCCLFSWDQICANSAASTFACGGTCGNGSCDDNEDCDSCSADCGECDPCPGTGSCTEPNDSPGCENEECCDTICELDPFCCMFSWDQLCADSAGSLFACGGTCGNGSCEDNEDCDSCEADCGECDPCPGTGSCTEPNDSPGCENEECCDAICELDPFCCMFAWDQLCADSAGSMFACGGTCGNGSCEDSEDCTSCAADCGTCPTGCPGDGSCCEANDTAGCDNEECCDSVCQLDPFCCDVSWDNICVSGAEMNDACGCQ